VTWDTYITEGEVVVVYRRGRLPCAIDEVRSGQAKEAIDDTRSGEGD
jgi:hypothetical protein